MMADWQREQSKIKRRIPILNLNLACGTMTYQYYKTYHFRFLSSCPLMMLAHVFPSAGRSDNFFSETEALSGLLLFVLLLTFLILLVLLCLCLFLILLVLLCPFLKDGSKGSHNRYDFINMLSHDLQLIQRRYEMSSDTIKALLVQTHGEQSIMLPCHTTEHIHLVWNLHHCQRQKSSLM
jgi:hypothetical protein